MEYSNSSLAKEQPIAKWTFVIHWTLASMAGLFLTFLIFPFVTDQVYDLVRSIDRKLISIFYPISIQATIGFLAVGLVVGALQFLVIRRFLFRPWIWIVITTVVFPVTIVGLDTVMPRQSSISEYLFIVVIAAFQWVYLRTQGSKAYQWIGIHIVILLLIQVQSFLFPSEGPGCCISRWQFIPGALLVGFFYGLLTGFVMYRILRKPPIISSSEPFGDIGNRKF